MLADIRKSMINMTPLAQQHGAVLIVSLIMLLVMTLLGISAMQNTIMEERMAGNMRDLQLAFHSAEVALREGETALREPVVPKFDGNSPGYLTNVDDDYKDEDFWYGSGFVLSESLLSVNIDGVFMNPAYYIEELSMIALSGSLEAGVAGDTTTYQVTARGYGNTETASVILRSFFIR